MRAGGGKAKGSIFERLIRDYLTTAYYPDGDGEFQRILSHPIPKKGEVRGDLMALKYIKDGGEKALIRDNGWPFTVECKHYASMKPFFSGHYTRESDLFLWMEQAEAVATPSGNKMPLVIFRLNRSAIMVVLRQQDFSRLEEIFGSFRKLMYCVKRSCLDADKEVCLSSLVVLKFLEFLEWGDWAVFKIAGHHKYIRSLMLQESVDGKSKD